MSIAPRAEICETAQRYRTSPRTLADTEAVTVEMDHSVVAAGIDFLTNIGRDYPLLVVVGVAAGGALLSWRFAARRAAAAEQRLAEIDKRIDGPSARELCNELAKIITPYRKGTYGKPIEDRLPPERRFLRNLRVQLRLSRQRRQRIEAMHAANFAECTRLREELESIRKAAEEAASAIERVTMVPRSDSAAADVPPHVKNDAPTLDRPTTIDDKPIDPTPPATADAGDATEIIGHLAAPTPADPMADDIDSTTDAVDDDVASLVFGALDVPALDEPFNDSDVVGFDPLAMAIDAIPDSSVDADDEPIDFDTLLAESVAKLGAPSPDDSLGGVAAFEQQLADAGIQSDSAASDEPIDEIVDDTQACLTETSAESDPQAADSAEETATPVADEVDAAVSADDAVFDDASGGDDPSLQTAAASNDDADADSKKKLTPDVSVEPDANEPTSINSQEEATSSDPPADIKSVADTSSPLIVTDELGFHQGVDDVFSDIDALMTDEIMDASPEFDPTQELPEPVESSETDACEASDITTDGLEAAFDPGPEPGHDESEAPDDVPMSQISKAKADIAAAIERADQSRQALETLDETLNESLARRRDMFSRIDSALAERQIQLVTDILRAEAEHLSLTDALEQIRANVDVMQSDVSRLLGGNPDNGGNPPKQ